MFMHMVAAYKVTTSFIQNSSTTWGIIDSILQYYIFC